MSSSPGIRVLNPSRPSLRGIARRLAAEGILARNGRPFAPQTLSRLLPGRMYGANAEGEEWKSWAQSAKTKLS